MSSIYKKLQEARIRLQEVPMTKSGKNEFAKYNYFELSDFLPQIQAIFNDIGLTGVISFGTELAELNIYEHEGDGKITITSPMSSAELKGCHKVQQLGAVQTYQRRYLWQSAMEIVEHDVLDATTGKEQVIDYKSLLESSATIEELTANYNSIPKNQKEQYKSIATKIKFQLIGEQSE